MGREIAPVVMPPPPPPYSGATPVEGSGLLPIRRIEKDRWSVEVPASSEEIEKLVTSGPKLSLVFLVMRSGFFIGGSGGVLSGVPSDEAGALDFPAMHAKFEEIKKAFPDESKVVVVCQSGLTRRVCDTARLSAAESTDAQGTRPLFPDQWLMEGEFAPGLLGSECSGLVVEYTALGGAMPARRLTPESLAQLKANLATAP